MGKTRSFEDEGYISGLRRNLTPPQLACRVADIIYEYCTLGGVGLQTVQPQDEYVPISYVMFLPALKPAGPHTVDIENASPDEIQPHETSAILRKMLSLHLETNNPYLGTDRVTAEVYSRMITHKLPYALLVGWAETDYAVDPRAVTLTYNDQIGPGRTLNVISTLLRGMIVDETDKMFSPVRTGLDNCISVSSFPSGYIKARRDAFAPDLSKPMVTL